jgi:hypothetical protein
VLLCTADENGKPCANGGIARGAVGRCHCECPAAFTGVNCQDEKCTNGPNGAPCQNGGNPVGVNGKCSCQCRVGYVTRVAIVSARSSPSVAPRSRPFSYGMHSVWNEFGMVIQVRGGELPMQIWIRRALLQRYDWVPDWRWTRSHRVRGDPVPASG